MADSAGSQHENFHATAVAVGDLGVMIIGPSGSGKSALALELIGMGAALIADDLTHVAPQPEGPLLSAPDRLRGVIEARGVGLVQVPWQASARLSLVVNMGEIELERLPHSPHQTTVAGMSIDTLYRVDAPYFACAIYNLLRYGRYMDAAAG